MFAQTLTIGSPAAADIRWLDWNEYRARQLAQLIEQHVRQWNRGGRKRKTENGNKKLK